MRRNLRLKAWLLLAVFVTEIFLPANTFALGSGPSQPEMASFTPAGTTEMVDPFTGDFSYNIPLMDVEGYPINIAYNSDIRMEQEASWVGLGWNLNLGSVTRSVRGLPDDFKGEQVSRTTNIKDMKITKIGVRAGIEFLGRDKLVNVGLNGGGSISYVHNNYKGFGMERGFSFGPSLGVGGDFQIKGSANVGININTLDGFSASSSLGASLVSYEGHVGIGVTKNSGYNLRTGQAYLVEGGTAGYYKSSSSGQGRAVLGMSNSYIPIGLHSYTPYPTVNVQSETKNFSATIGGEFSAGIHANASLYGSKTTQQIKEETINGITSKQKKVSKQAYGYLYVEESDFNSLMDFNRDKPTVLNSSVKNLSPTNFTYDIYTVSGQGASGSFRPFRNDLGSLGDPVMSSNNSDDISIGVEYGLGQQFHGGYNDNVTKVVSTYGAWLGQPHSTFRFKEKMPNTAYENVYFKAAGELTESDIHSFENDFGGMDAIAFQLQGMNTTTSLVKENGTTFPLFENKLKVERKPRAKNFSYFTAEQANNIHGNTSVKSYSDNYTSQGNDHPLVVDDIDRISADISLVQSKKPHHIAEIVQTNVNGERFVYGIAAYNKEKVEKVFSTNEKSSNDGALITPDVGNPYYRYDFFDPTQNEPVSFGRVVPRAGEDSPDNNAGLDGYYSESVVPAYAHSYLLTEKQSPDYVDVNNDGISSDDLGNAWKFNYTRTSDNYGWRIPYSLCNIDEGFRSTDLDQKASYSYGFKELWYAHSIESKNYIAEFVLEAREDGLGAAIASKSDIQGPFIAIDNTWGGRPSPGNINTTNQTQSLKKIILYSKKDRVVKGDNAVPLQTIEFFYDYELCKGVENQIDQTKGKLTLRSIKTTYGNEEGNEPSVYDFRYSGETYTDALGTEQQVGGINPNYHPLHMDRWGYYKHPSVNPGVANKDFPYVVQEHNDPDFKPHEWASAWCLRQIITPSSGKIVVDYESDDYAYVQNKQAMQMFPVLNSNSSPTPYKLYDGNGGVFNNLFIQKPAGVSSSLTNLELRKMFFGEKGQLQDMYFRFKVNINDNNDINDLQNDNEYVSGYVTAVDINYAANDQLAITIAGNQSPISEASWSFFRENLQDVLYKRPNIKDGDLKAFLKGVRANRQEVKQYFTGVRKHMKNNEIAQKFEPGKSFIRLNSPIKKKLGGGARVKRIELHNNWDQMATDGTNEIIGQEYDYTISDENGNEMSSGVITYETFVGNDENPWRNPTEYVSADSRGHIPAIKSYQETPYGESFIPIGQLGYSSVKVKNIHYNNSLTAKSIIEHKFYTAKDFPVQFRETKLEGDQLYNSPSNGKSSTFPFTTSTTQSEFAASQGYSIILNDMHGKKLSEENYSLVDDPNDASKKIKKLVAGVKYHYKQKDGSDGKELVNEVQVISDDGTVDQKLLGVEYDITIDSQHSYEKTSTASNKANLDILPPFIPIPIYYYDIVEHINEARIVVLTKTIQQYGILEKIESYTDQYTTTIENKMYDGTTGQVLLTETVDEHGRNEFQFRVPAYLTNGLQRMGPAYTNSGYCEEIVEEIRGATCTAAGNYQNSGNLKHGDEVFVKRKADGTVRRAWVDLNFTANNSNDPLVNNGCEYKFDLNFQEDGGQLNLVNNNDPQPYYNMFSYASLIGSLSSVTTYSPTKELVDYLKEPYIDIDFQTTQYTTIEGYRHTLDKLFGGQINDPTVLGKVEFEEAHGVSSTAVYGIDELFNLDKPISTEYYYGNSGQSILRINYTEATSNREFFDMLSIDNDYTTTGLHDGYLLCKFSYDDNGTNKDMYFVRIYRKNSGLTFLDPQTGLNRTVYNPDLRNVAIVNPSTGEPSAPPCPFTYKLQNATGDYINDLVDGDELMVVRSGNKNLLSQNEGMVVADENPVLIVNNQFKGIKSANDINITQISAVEFSENYLLKNQYAGLSTNKFISQSDGNYKVKKMHRYNASRYQNGKNIETAKDGYFVNPPPLWQAEDRDCYFILNSPFYNYQNTWRTEEEVLAYNRSGMAVEAKNSLDIHSSILADRNGKVEAVVANAELSAFGLESFENYKQLQDATEIWQHPFSFLTQDINLLYTVGDKGYSIDGLTQQHEEVLVEGIAHTGNYSVFLRGDDSDVGGPADYTSYKEKPLQTLVSKTLGNEDLEQIQYVDLSNYPYTPFNRAQMEINFAETYPLGSAVQNEFYAARNTATSGANELTYHYTASSTSGFQPKVGKYYFSIWVKEILSNNEARYKGFSPHVRITTGSTVNKRYNINTKEIDGWYQITGVFEYEDLNDDLTITLDGGLWGAFFDDIRVHPSNSNLQSYVYDDKSGRLKAQLDENNYATFFDYNAEGILFQTRKETAAGVLTVSESRQGTKKR